VVVVPDLRGGEVLTRAALYLRVSTEDQTEENQAPELHQLAARRGWEPVEYREQGSAAKVRPVLDRLMADARAGRLGAVVVWALDRLDRSHLGCMVRVAELDRLGVAVVSVREGWLDTSGPARSLLVSVFAWAAEQERARLIERTRAGLARARREGKRIGRPRASPLALSAAADRVAVLGLRQAAREAGVGAATLHRFVKRSKTVPPE
jgi:DNA invertase Pin-like site-specific DNA recombinase